MKNGLIMDWETIAVMNSQPQAKVCEFIVGG